MIVLDVFVLGITVFTQHYFAAAHMHPHDYLGLCARYKFILLLLLLLLLAENIITVPQVPLLFFRPNHARLKTSIDQ